MNLWFVLFGAVLVYVCLRLGIEPHLKQRLLRWNRSNGLARAGALGVAEFGRTTALVHAFSSTLCFLVLGSLWLHKYALINLARL